MSAPDFSTSSFNSRLFNLELFIQGLFNHCSWSPVERLKCPAIPRVLTFSIMAEGVEKFTVEKSGVEKSRVEAWGCKVQG